ncbi:MAG TPA: flagellar hook-length control protein FliK [Polyangiaceae bacterium]
MGDGISTGLTSGAASRAHDRADDEKTTQAQAERWATLLGAQLSSLRPKTLESEPTSAWHSGAGDMTPSNATATTGSNATVSAAGEAGEASDPSENRVIVRVDGGDLGEVSLVVDRKEGAIRVTISAADAGAEAALGLERAGLLQALQDRGITVDSVNVVRASNFGTVLAPPRSNATQRSREATEAESQDDEQARRRLARKLNLIG